MLAQGGENISTERAFFYTHYPIYERAKRASSLEIETYALLPIGRVTGRETPYLGYLPENSYLCNEK